MKRFLVCAAVLCGGALTLPSISTGHGGSYLGPGDTVPPGGGGGGGGGGSPTGPGAGGPSTGGPSGPKGPSTPGNGPGTGPGGRGAGASTGAPGSAADLTTWEFWWGFNKHAYLNLKTAIHGGGIVSESDVFFLPESSRERSRWKPSEEAIRGRVVPALKKALEAERSNDIVTGCLIALARIGDVTSGDDGTSEIAPILVRFLADPNQEIAETAAVALGILANEASVDTLAGLARDADDARKRLGTTEVPWRTRAFATYGLGLIGNRTARNDVRAHIVRVLIDVLEKPDASTRDLKVAALTALGLVPLDVDAGGTPDAATDHSSSRQTQIGYLKRLFLDRKGQHHLVRAHAPTAMARLLPGAPAALREEIGRVLAEALEPFAKETQPAVHSSCVLALGMIATAGPDPADQEIRKRLVRIADEGDLQSRNFALIALAQIGGRGRGDEFEAGRADVRNFILSKVVQGKSHQKPWAGLAVGVMERALLDDGQLASAGATATLRDAFIAAGQPERAGAFAIGLGIARDASAGRSVLEKMKSTSEPGAKGYLCLALGLMDAREHVGALRDVVRASKFNPDLLNQAAIGLGLLGDKDLVPELVTMLSEASSAASQAAVASALGFIGDSRSIDPLIALLEDDEHKTDRARGFAAVALGIVADKEAMPWNAKISIGINYRANTTTLTGEDGSGILDIL